MACLFCNSTTTKSSPYENTVFNHKEYEYLKCGNCNLVYVQPFPEADDFDLMYPVTYQGELFTKPSGAYNWLFDKVEKTGKYTTILDYGCGSANFVVEALAKGYQVTGTEYNPDLVESLKKALPDASFLTLQDFSKLDNKYDIIFLGNVLEHLTNPVEIIKYLKSKLSANGVLVLEGPVEDNFSMASTVRKWYFSKRKKAGIKVSHAPRHIFYSNYDNQLAVFTRGGFKTMIYEVSEHSWPFPGSVSQVKTIKDFTFYIIGNISIIIGRFIPKNGNKFFYVGRLAGDNSV